MIKKIISNGSNFSKSYYMFDFKGIEHIFFDLDHTLWDFDRNSALTFAHIFQRNKIQIPIADFLVVYQPINLQYWKYYREGQVTKEQLRYGRLKKSFDQLAVHIDKYLIDKLSEEYIDNLTNTNYLFEGVIEVLECYSKRFELHIITNGFKEVQHQKMLKSGIAPYFNSVTTSECAGVKKPNSRIFYHALNTANASVANSIMIGDNYEADILGAQNIGMKAILLDHRQTIDSNLEGLVSIHKILDLKYILD